MSGDSAHWCEPWPAEGPWPVPMVPVSLEEARHLFDSNAVPPAAHCHRGIAAALRKMYEYQMHARHTPGVRAEWMNDTITRGFRFTTGDDHVE